MTKEEAARILDPETTRDELWKFDTDERLNACDEACRMGADALREQQERENPKPLTLDELRQMDGEPVWIHFIGGVVIRNDGWFIVSQIGTSEIFLSGKVSVYKNFWYYGETWLAYRQKPEEADHG